MDRKALTEQDVRSKFISPAIHAAGWDAMRQLREEVQLTRGRVIVKGELSTRAEAKRADYVPYYRPDLPIAVVEAKDNNHALGAGMQQALGYAPLLDVPFVFNSIEHYRLAISRTAFVKGRDPYPYMPAFNASLFLSANAEDVRRAVADGLPAGQVLPTEYVDDEGETELRIAFDFDGILADDSAEAVFKARGLDDFHASERAHARGHHAARVGDPGGRGDLPGRAGEGGRAAHLPAAHLLRRSVDVARNGSPDISSSERIPGQG